jgi:hypothetical protein
MIITVDDEAEEKFFAPEINPDTSIKPKDINPEGLTPWEILVIETKQFIKQHKKPHPVVINWNDRKQELLDKTSLPLSLIDLIADYEVCGTQKDFLNLKNWFLFYDNVNRFVRTTRISLFLNFCLTSFPALILTGSLDHAANQTSCQIAIHVLSWMNIILIFTAVAMAIFYTGAKSSCHHPDFVDRFELHRKLRDCLSVDLNKASKELLYKSQATTKTLLRRSTKSDSRFFLFTLFTLTPFNALICILGLLSRGYRLRGDAVGYQYS